MCFCCGLVCVNYAAGAVVFDGAMLKVYASIACIVWAFLSVWFGIRVTSENPIALEPMVTESESGRSD